MYIKKNVKIKNGYSYTAIYNFNSKETYLVNKDVGSKLLSKQIESLHTETIETLINLGILTTEITQSECEPEVFEYSLFDDCNRYKRYDTVYFEATNRCNFNCIHCYADMGREGNEFLTLPMMEKYLAHMSDVSKCNIRFTGGEPFLNPHIRKILKYTSEHILPVQRHSIVTNGSGRLEDILYALELGYEVQISIYGMNGNTFSKIARVSETLYEKVKNNLLALSKTEYAGQIVCLFSINTITFDEMELFVNYISTLGFRVILNRPASIGRANDNWDILSLSLEKHMDFSRYNYQLANGFNRYCYHACKLTWAYVDVYGNVKPCAFIRDGFTFGNLAEQTMKEIRETVEFQRFRSINADDFEKCSECELEYCCTGGCCGETLVHDGNIKGTYTWCNIKPYENKYFINLKDEKIIKVQKYAGGTFDFFDT